MDYLSSILWFIGWPVLIFATYQIVKLLLKKQKYLND